MMLPGYGDRVTFVRKLCREIGTTDPMGDMPLIDQFFKKVAIDLIGPIVRANDKRHRYILTLVDYKTRYPAAVVPLKNIDKETVAETFLDM